MAELAANARAGQEAAEAQLHDANTVWPHWKCASRPWRRRKIPSEACGAASSAR